MNACLRRHALRTIQQRFERLYGPACAERCTARFAFLLGRYSEGPTPPPGEKALWSEKDSLLIVYGGGITAEGHAPLAGLRRFLKQRVGDAFSTLHILPFFPSSSDDGFSVVHYRNVAPELGGWEDIRALAEDYDLAFDLVLNHISRSSGWFHDFITGVAPARDYFITADPTADTSGVVRPRTHPLLTPVPTQRGIQHVWTTFSSDQVDINYSNPDLLFEILDILLYYISRGARILRLDAIAFLWKQPGTACIHLPQTHEIVRLMRDLVDIAAPGTLLLSETNVPHAENIQYFGDGDEAHLVYQFSLPPLLLYALIGNSPAPFLNWLRKMEPPPSGCSFLNFTASHDGIGVRPLQDLAPTGAVEELAAHVLARGGRVSTKSNPDGSESPYELNITWFDAMGRNGEPEDIHFARFLCSQIIALSLKGIPALYLHTLTATPNDQAGFAETGRARSLNRKTWAAAELHSLLDTPETPAARAMQQLTRLLRLRSTQAAFHPDQPQSLLETNSQVLCLMRGQGDTAVHLVANLTASPVAIPPAFHGLYDLISESILDHPTLTPYACAWLMKPASA